MLGDVADPARVGSVDGELATHEIVVEGRLRVAPCRPVLSAAIDPLDPGSSHQALDSSDPDVDSLAESEFSVDPRRDP